MSPGDQHPSPGKFQGEQHDRHGGKLHWPGFGGLPFRGDHPPILSQKELHRLRPVVDAWHATFDLSDEEDAAWYNWVRDRSRNGWFVIDYIRRWLDKKEKKVLVYCEWSQVYVQL